MPSSAVYTFTDPDDWTTSFRGSRAQLTITGRGQFAAALIWIHLHRLQMQRLSENLPRIVHSAFVSGHAIVTFPIHTGLGLLWSGVPLLPTNIVRHVEGGNAFQYSPGPAFWDAMSLTVADWHRSHDPLPHRRSPQWVLNLSESARVCRERPHRQPLLPSLLLDRSGPPQSVALPVDCDVPDRVCGCRPAF